MAIAISGIIGVTVIIVALIISAAYITTHQKKERPKRKPTQKEIDQFFESYECCTSVINWVEPDQQPSHSGFFLITEETSHGNSMVSMRWFYSKEKEWLETKSRIIAWAELPEPYKKPSRTA